MSIEDFTQTRNGDELQPVLHMRWPVDEETTASLRLLTYERLSVRRRVLRWLERRLRRLMAR